MRKYFVVFKKYIKSVYALNSVLRPMPVFVSFLVTEFYQRYSGKQIFAVYVSQRCNETNADAIKLAMGFLLNNLVYLSVQIEINPDGWLFADIRHNLAKAWKSCDKIQNILIITHFHRILFLWYVFQQLWSNRYPPTL